MRILIIQTAFLGDVILSLPIAEVIKRKYPSSIVDFLCIPKTAELIKRNDFINEILIYDKKGTDKGIKGFLRIRKKIKTHKYDVIIGIQRHLKTTILSSFSGADLSIGFENSALSFFYKVRIKYRKKHEILRNLDLLQPLGIYEKEIIRPRLNPSEKDEDTIDKIFKGLNVKKDTRIICAAPGSVWFTKRYPVEKFISLFDRIDKKDYIIILIGDNRDNALCSRIQNESTNNNIYNYAGKLSIMESVALIRRCSILLTNDSAPLHIANAVSTQVIAFFGSTIKDFGFFPYGQNDVVFEVNGLKCRPCTNHGKDYCKIKTFDCMMKINPEDVSTKLMKILERD